MTGRRQRLRRGIGASVGVRRAGRVGLGVRRGRRRVGRRGRRRWWRGAGESRQPPEQHCFRGRCRRLRWLLRAWALAGSSHTTALMMSARTERIRPMVVTAPTIVRNCAMPGRPLELGLMLMSIGNITGNDTGTETTDEMRSNTTGLLTEQPRPMGAPNRRGRLELAAVERVLAASAVITDPAGRVLLVLRDTEPEKGCWSVPGGSAEPDESLPRTAAREAFEETGLISRGRS